MLPYVFWRVQLCLMVRECVQNTCSSLQSSESKATLRIGKERGFFHSLKVKIGGGVGEDLKK